MPTAKQIQKKEEGGSSPATKMDKKKFLQKTKAKSHQHSSPLGLSVEEFL
jgi:hypothetical protein